ncbi:hypothetical protein [Sphaerisporangium fuscum]|uniref:hypothetical protein n=1 Tax=Sphaerisporangium fuscum TaxID=2835868 RepID=UPI001BDC5206|nr:hypothetical protein [Sphaerisporangium fuscum]
MIVEHVKKTRLTRNRFLAVAGATLVGVATSAWFPGRAEAAPDGCYGAPGCSCCSATTCCSSGCTSAYTCGGKHCWTSCAYLGSTLYRFDCCDYYKGGNLCICRVNNRACS